MIGVRRERVQLYSSPRSIFSRSVGMDLWYTGAMSDRQASGLRRKRLRFLVTRRGLESLLTEALASTGVLWLILECVSYLLDVNQYRGWLLTSVFGLAVVISAFVRALPVVEKTWKSKSPRYEIRLLVGNLFDEKGPIAIPSSEYFDTSLDDIPEDTLKAQLARREFGGDTGALDARIHAALENVKGVVDPAAAAKTIRYPPGTVAAFDSNGRTVCMVVTAHRIDGSFTTTPDLLWIGLRSLWRVVRQKGIETTALP